MGTSSSQFSGSVSNGFQRQPQRSPNTSTIEALRHPWYERLGHAFQTVWRQLTRNKKVTIGLVIVFFFILVAAFGPLFIHSDPNRLSEDAQAAPSAAHWLGTTAVGQDIFNQLVVGTRSSIFWGFATGIAVTVLSIIVGLVSGYFGGVIDEVLSLLTNVFLVLPALPLAIVLASYFPRGPLTVALVITFTSWSWGARVLRSQTLSMRSREFVTAARANGETTWRIIFFEIFPNEISIVAANFVSTTLYVILASASLEFLGLGDPNGISWGDMFYWAQKANALISGLWWWFIPPGICIAVLGAGLSLINFGIDEIADPRLRKERAPKLITEGGNK
ncbi:ABC transporter permease [Dictyobacter aurantiacus]|uniref:Peptide ABC transporter permease n=1 Tax=Dictyobacter aurantiacus TaxID=1936993 RepID=A0A401ZEF8_9CHLR|nr:ABC transporter permease [Dictyobacter aurantiacus]GCE05261.1 peptide ABC transporter permease [Dictyobacter aurantiacus]